MPVLPAASVTRTLSVLLAVRVSPGQRPAVLADGVARRRPGAAIVERHFDNISRGSMLLSVLLMVCAAVWVMKSLLLLPVSALKLRVLTVRVGAVVSMVTDRPLEALLTPFGRHRWPWR